MASKKKGGKGKGGKGGKKERRDVLHAGDVEAASIEELNQKIGILEKEKNKEEEYRNYMQLERDKVNAFWEITKKDLEDKKAELRNKDREIEEMEERQQVEIKVYKQKVKHLLYEHQNSITAFKSNAELGLKIQQDDLRGKSSEVHKDKHSLKLEMKEQGLAHEELIRQMKLEHAKEITKLRQAFDLQVRELELKYEKKMRILRSDMELRRKQEIHEIEERKNSHINDLMKKHERAFAEVKNYYNDITHNNLDLIRTLKEDVAEMKKKETQNEKLMYEIAQENKRLSDPLNKALKEVETLRQHSTSYEKDKTSLQQTKMRLNQAEKQVKNLEWENEILQQRFTKVQAERDQLYEKFEGTVYEIQQKAGLKCLMLEKKVESMDQDIEKKEAQVAEILVAANLQPSVAQQVNNKLEEVLDNKNRIIKALQYDIAKVSKAHNDLIRVYDAKLVEFGIPPDELGFRPLFTNTTKGPAGLVSGS